MLLLKTKKHQTPYAQAKEASVFNRYDTLTAQRNS